jgi:hypothetical protein
LLQHRDRINNRHYCRRLQLALRVLKSLHRDRIRSRPSFRQVKSDLAPSKSHQQFLKHLRFRQLKRRNSYNKLRVYVLRL